jgi:CspA family cold shock protein
MPTGTVVHFDEHVGLGHVDADDGRRYLFHCVEIADGTRTIDVGTTVQFDLMVKLGSPEASNLRPAPETAP